jgi:hypothetical protein
MMHSFQNQHPMHSCGPQPFHTGAHNHHEHAHYHGGFCHCCCHPANQCCCHIKGCRKEAKEVTLTAEISSKETDTLTVVDSGLALLKMSNSTKSAIKNIENDKININTGIIVDRNEVLTDFIGGGCCVHLSAEYMPLNPTANSTSFVTVKVSDSEGTSLMWNKSIPSDSPYSISEDIITTYPGARLFVKGENIIVRVRWCEVFSC